MHTHYNLILQSIIYMFRALEAHHQDVCCKDYGIKYVHVCGIWWVVNVWLHSGRSSLVGGRVNFKTNFLMLSLKGLKHAEDTLRI